MTPRERVLAAVRGETLDRIPVSAWYHFRLDPPAGKASRMGEEEIAFYRRYKPDFLKVMHDVPYEPTPPIEQPADWAKVALLNPETGNFGDQLVTLREIRAGVGSDVPMIDTVFSVYHYAQELSGKRLLDHLRTDPLKVHAGLQMLAQSLARYARACVGAGCDGIYYALSGASAEGATLEEYVRHFLPYDLEILKAVRDTPFTVLHLHGYRNLYFEIVNELPASAVCWSDRAGGPSLAEAREIHSGCLIGGMDETCFAGMSPAEIAEQARDAVRQTGGQGLILAPGCAIPTDTNPALIDALMGAVAA